MSDRVGYEAPSIRTLSAAAVLEALGAPQAMASGGATGGPDPGFGLQKAYTGGRHISR